MHSHLTKKMRNNIIKYLETKGFQIFKDKICTDKMLILVSNINHWIEFQYYTNSVKLYICNKNGKSIEVLIPDQTAIADEIKYFIKEYQSNKDFFPQTINLLSSCIKMEDEKYNIAANCYFSTHIVRHRHILNCLYNLKNACVKGLEQYLKSNYLIFIVIYYLNEPQNFSLKDLKNLRYI